MNALYSCILAYCVAPCDRDPSSEDCKTVSISGAVQSSKTGSIQPARATSSFGLDTTGTLRGANVDAYLPPSLKDLL